jgi:glycine/D-amino acid oxidase-like deaminating enzyme
MAEPRPFDWAVVGAGLVGSALAFGLVQQGQRVVLLDAGDDRWHGSGGNFGLVWVQGKGVVASACPSSAPMPATISGRRSTVR